MQNATTELTQFPAAEASAAGLTDPLTDLLRDGARRLLVHAVETEVAMWIADRVELTEGDGHHRVARNGHAHPRTVVTGVGRLEVAMPRVHDRRPAGQARSRSKVARTIPLRRRSISS